MSAALLRTAAQTLREKAEAATPGPWEADLYEVSQHWSRPEPWQSIASNEVACMSYCYGGSARGIERTEDAEFIALMDPTVALAVADLLDGWADDIAQHGGHHRSDERALAVARAVLRRES